MVKSKGLKEVLQEDKGMERWMLYSKVESSLQKLLKEQNRKQGGEKKKSSQNSPAFLLKAGRLFIFFNHMM